MPYVSCRPRNDGVALENNRITEVGGGAFRSCPTAEYIRLNHNLITSISPSAFVGTKTKDLQLQSNKLLCVPDFRSIKHTLEALNIANNGLGKCKENGISCYNQFYKLIMNLQGNSLRRVPWIIHCASALRDLDLRHNKFTTVCDLSGVLGSPNYHYQLRLTNNPLVCSCSLLWVSKYEKKHSLRAKVTDRACNPGICTRLGKGDACNTGKCVRPKTGIV